MQNKVKIEVRQMHQDGFYTVIETIFRKCWAEQIGNFNPIFCRYQKKRTLVHSDNGDLSDMFRREESYKESLFIKLPYNPEWPEPIDHEPDPHHDADAYKKE